MVSFARFPPPLPPLHIDNDNDKVRTFDLLAFMASKQTPYYERDVDFDDLARRDPDFASISQIGKKNGFIDFQNPQIVQQLTKSLLKTDFHLRLDLPDDRLCPPVPVRWNYVRWIQDLLDTTSEEYRDIPEPERAVVGLDIGVGASCIYGLLACSTRRGWRMAGTEIDAASLDWARRNVAANGLGDRIRLQRVSADAPRLVPPLDDLQLAGLDVVMTNPPFYSSHDDFRAAYSAADDDEEGVPSSRDRKLPSAVTAGADNEMICPGGDVGFVTRILRESLALRGRVRWYTAMLSRLSSLQQIIARIKEAGITNFAVTSLHPGRKTKRWAVAWSFGDLRPRNDVARHGGLVLSVLPLATAQTIKVPERDGRRVDEVMRALDVRWMWRAVRDEGVMECKGNVWSRAARRKKQREEADDQEGGGKRLGKAEEDEDEDEDEVAMAVKISCRDEEVEVRWLRGQDHVLFTSFCGMLKRALNER